MGFIRVNSQGMRITSADRAIALIGRWMFVRWRRNSLEITPFQLSYSPPRLLHHDYWTAMLTAVLATHAALT